MLGIKISFKVNFTYFFIFRFLEQWSWKLC